MTESIERNYLRGIVVLSIAIPLLVAFLIYGPQGASTGSSWVYMLPHLNASINGTTSLLLLAGLFFIRRKQITYHRTAMTTAFILGTCFLTSYIIYHASVPSTSFEGEGSVRMIYYFLLLTHIVLAAVVVPLVLLAFYFAIKDKISQHRRIVRYAYPIWLYVSVTGVLVYLLIRPYYA